MFFLLLAKRTTHEVMANIIAKYGSEISIKIGKLLKNNMRDFGPHINIKNASYNELVAKAFPVVNES